MSSRGPRTLSRWGILLAAAAATVPARAEVLTFDGEVPAGEPAYFFLPFEVPPGTAEIEIRHDDQSDENVLDWGLDDPSGYRGWGGGTSEPAIVDEKAASRAYVPGPIAPGTWRVVVGKALIESSPATYHVEVELRAAPTLAPQPERGPYVPAGPLVRERRWYAGDFHVHSKESTDAQPSVDDIATFARSRGLDFVEVSDHNTVTQLEYVSAAQARHPDLLLLPGIEVTTYQGHANAIGATKWIDFRLGVAGVSIDSILDAASAQGAIISINHPALTVGGACIGCGWELSPDPARIAAVEIATWGLDRGSRVFSAPAIDLWDEMTAQGHHIAAVGGSDDHKAGVDEQQFQSPIGSPTTMVLADELSAAGVLDAVRRGRTVVKLQDATDPMVELTSEVPDTDGTILARSTRLRAKVTGTAGASGLVSVRFVKNGEPQDPVEVPGDGFTHAIVVPAPEAGEDRWRAEVLIDDQLRTLTSNVYVKLDPAGPEASAGSDDDGGCRAAPAPPSPLGLALFALAAASLIRRARRGSSRR